MRFAHLALTAVVLAVPAWLVPGCSAAAPGEALGRTDDTSALGAIVQHPTKDACGPVGDGEMRCHAKIRTDITDNAAPQGYGPPDLRSAYNLPTTGGAGQTVAVIDAQDDPDAESDLAVYRAQYGLPPCTTANGCFKKVNQSGVQGSYPAADAGWAGEIALDLDMVSAVCPTCKIILVEATQATTADLGAAVNTAVALGATAISNSYGGSETSSDVSASSQYFNHPGVLITASAGDQGYGAEFPASSQYVLGVGGTSLVTSSSSRGWAESAWSGTGSGCSQVIGKPSFQKDTGCSKRTVADVSAVADPNTGVAVYVSYGGNGGWNVFGGTSAASPIVAATFALVGKAGATNAYPYANTGDFYDVTSGSNGSCSPSYLCKAAAGFDGPTGWGTPNGEALAGGSAPPDAGVGSGSGSSSSSKASSSSSVVSSSEASSSVASSSKASSSSIESASSSSVASSSSSEPTSCNHGICAQGKPLVPSCDPCADDVCSYDPYCCTTRWDNICVSEVRSICGESCRGR